MPPKTALCLGDLAYCVKDSCNCSEAILETYVSTESMLPDKGGIALADAVPQSGSVNRYKAGDILVSNIRPYFKKIWRANRDGSCSKDIIVIRPYDDSLTDYLYALLLDDCFFDYVMLGSKGTKMPRGDKGQIFLYPVQERTLTEMLVIGKIIATINSKITRNESINDNLMVLSGLIFQKWIRTFCKGECVSAIPNTDMQSLDHLCSKITDGSHFSPEAEENGTHAMFSVKDMRTNRFDRSECKMIGDSAFEKLKSAGCVPIRDDLVIAKDGSYLKELFLINENHEDAILSSIAIFRPDSETIYPEILLAYLRLPEVLATVKDNFVSGSAVPRIVLKSFKELQLYVPSLAKQEEILPCLRTIREIIFNKELETIKLTQLRDYLLPKLICGNVDCSCQTLLD